MFDKIRSSIHRKFRLHEYNVLFNRTTTALPDAIKNRISCSHTVLVNIGKENDSGELIFILNNYVIPTYISVRAENLGRVNGSITVYKGTFINGPSEIIPVEEMSLHTRLNVNYVIDIINRLI